MSERTCGWARDRLPYRVTGELPAAERDSLEEHLARCGMCRSEARLLSELHQARPVPSEEVRRRVRAGAVAGEPSDAGREATPGPGPYRRPVVAVGGVAAAAVAAVSSLWILAGDDPRQDLIGTGGEIEELAVEEMAEEWVVAGEPVFSELPPEALEHLLHELNE